MATIKKKMQIDVKTTGTEKARKSFVGVGKSIDAMTKSILGGAAGMYALKKAWDVASASARLESRSKDLTSAYESLTRAQGINSKLMLGELKEASAGTISDMELMQRANQAILLGLPVTAKDMGLLAKAGRSLGKAMGIDARAGLESLIVGTGRQSKLWLDNLGIIINTEKAYSDFAATMGKTSEQLTDAKKKTVFYNTTMDALRLNVGKLNRLEETSADSLDRGKVAAEKLGIALGEKLKPFIDTSAEAFATMAENTIKSMDEFDKFVELAEKVSGKGDKKSVAESFMGSTMEMEAGAAQFENMSIIIGKMIDQLNAGATAQQLMAGNAGEFIEYLIEQNHLGENWAESQDKALVSMVASQAELINAIQFIKARNEEQIINNDVVKNQLDLTIGSMKQLTLEQEKQETTLERYRSLFTQLPVDAQELPKVQKKWTQEARQTNFYLLSASQSVATLISSMKRGETSFSGLLSVAGTLAGMFMPGLGAGIGAGSNILRAFGAAGGADFMADRPTLILAGESGREHVKVTPLQPAPINNTSNSSLTVNVYGNYTDVDRLAQEIAERSNQGFNQIAVNA